MSTESSGKPSLFIVMMLSSVGSTTAITSRFTLACKHLAVIMVGVVASDFCTAGPAENNEADRCRRRCS